MGLVWCIWFVGQYYLTKKLDENGDTACLRQRREINSRHERGKEKEKEKEDERSSRVINMSSSNTDVDYCPS